MKTFPENSPNGAVAEIEVFGSRSDAVLFVVGEIFFHAPYVLIGQGGSPVFLRLPLSGDAAGRVKAMDETSKDFSTRGTSVIPAADELFDKCAA